MRFVERAGTVFHFILRVFLVLSLIMAVSPPSMAQRRSANPIVVQVAAFKSRASADQLASALRAKGLEARVVPGADVDRVVVGPFPDEAAANNALATLKTQGYDGYIRRDLALPGGPAPAAATPRPAPRVERPAPAPAPATNPNNVITGVTNQPARSQPPVPARPAEPAPAPATIAQAEPTPAPPVPAEPTPAPPVPPEPVTTPTPAEPAVPPVVETQQVNPVLTPPEAAPPPEPAPPPTPVPAQPPTPEPAPPNEAPGLIRPTEPAVQPGQVGGSRLRLLILEGGGAINNTRQRTAREPVVQVVDENDRPVAGVAITFALPSRGASGVFANGARSMTVLTNAQGTATATGFTPNAVAGDLSMQVTGSYQGQTLSATIAQTNVAAGAGMSATTIGIIGAVAAGAAVGAVVALTGGDNSQPTPTRPSGTASVRTGGVTIGAPSQ